jgi:hypothetical protein
LEGPSDDAAIIKRSHRFTGTTQLTSNRHGWDISEQERQLQDLESRFPLASGEAFAAARAQVLASGQSVLQSKGGFIVRVFPDGRKQRLKPVEAPTPVTPGTTFIIR